MTENRWAAFTDEELYEIYSGLTTDDGIAYPPEGMAVEIIVVWQSRGHAGEPDYWQTPAGLRKRAERSVRSEFGR